jgi:hypothetical protein
LPATPRGRGCHLSPPLSLYFSSYPCPERPNHPSGSPCSSLNHVAIGSDVSVPARVEPSGTSSWSSPARAKLRGEPWDPPMSSYITSSSSHPSLGEPSLFVSGDYLRQSWILGHRRAVPMIFFLYRQIWASASHVNCCVHCHRFGPARRSPAQSY